MRNITPTIAVAFLARCTDLDYEVSFRRFVASYLRYSAGIDHSLYIIFKGYPNTDRLTTARQIFNDISFEPVFLDDNSFDIGAYIQWSTIIRETFICPLNSNTEIICEDWLLKLYNNLQLVNVGLVGATGSFESLREMSRCFPPFPNIHIHTSGFMIRTELFRLIAHNIKISNKIDALHFESGPKSMTRKVLASGQRILLVGRNGRGYSPKWWPMSETFRQGSQSNLLIADNQTRNFALSSYNARRHLVDRTWGYYIEGKKTLPDKYVTSCICA